MTSRPPQLSDLDNEVTGFLSEPDKPTKEAKKLGDYIALWAVVCIIGTMISLCAMGNVQLWRWFW